MHINDNKPAAGIAPTELIKVLTASLPKGEVILNPVAQAIFAESKDLTKGNITIRNASDFSQGNLAGVYYHPPVAFTTTTLNIL